MNPIYFEIYFDLVFLPILLGDVDEVRNLQKAQAAAERIYQFFKSEMGRPPNDTEH